MSKSSAVISPSPGKNPYRPGVGLAPTYLAGRQKEMLRFAATLRGAPEIPANVRLTGLRGVGKTVLLKRFAEISEEISWAALTLEVEPRHNSSSQLVTVLSRQLRLLEERLSTAVKVRRALGRSTKAARRLVSVKFEGVQMGLGGDLELESTELASALAQAVNSALEADKEGLVLLFDEAQILRDEKDRQGEHPLSLLLAAVAGLQKEGFPLALVLCGLPTLAVNLLNARTYSERMFRGEEVTSLRSDEARAAFLEPLRQTEIKADDALVDAVLTTVDGYPYFIQLWGAELWDAAAAGQVYNFDTDLLSLVEEDIYRRLDLDFFEPRVQSLTPAEQDLLTDSASCSYPPLVISDLSRRSPKSDGNINVLLGRLVQANVLFRPRKGQYLYTAPGFSEYLKRRAEKQQ